MAELRITIANRTITNIKEFREMFAHLKDGSYLVIVKDNRKRSIPQNSYYWGVVVPMVRSGLYEQGYDDVRTNDDAHDVLKSLFLKKRLVNRVSGDEIPIDGSTTKLSISEFNDYIEEVARWASQYLQIVIPSPNEQFVLWEDWEDKLINDAQQ